MLPDLYMLLDLYLLVDYYFLVDLYSLVYLYSLRDLYMLLDLYSLVDKRLITIYENLTRRVSFHLGVCEPGRRVCLRTLSMSVAGKQSR